MGAVMLAEASEARRAYQRKYRLKNRERINSQKKGMEFKKPRQSAAVQS